MTKKISFKIGDDVVRDSSDINGAALIRGVVTSVRARGSDPCYRIDVKPMAHIWVEQHDELDLVSVWEDEHPVVWRHIDDARWEQLHDFAQAVAVKLSNARAMEAELIDMIYNL